MKGTPKLPQKQSTGQTLQFSYEGNAQTSTKATLKSGTRYVVLVLVLGTYSNSTSSTGTSTVYYNRH